MSRDALEHGMAVALWAAVGAVITVSVSPTLWWLGALVGGVAGYFFMDFRDLRDGFAYALQSVAGVTFEKLDRALSLVLWLMAFLMNLALVLALIGAGALILKFGYTSDHLRIAVVGVALILLGVASYFTCLFTVEHGVPCSLCRVGYGFSYPYRDVGKWEMLARHSVPFVFFQVFWVSMKACAWPILHRRQILDFARTFFFYIHTQKRVLRAADTVLAVSVAYFMAGTLPMVLVAAALGFLIGIVHWELVSVRMLGVVPNGGRN